MYFCEMLFLKVNGALQLPTAVRRGGGAGAAGAGTAGGRVAQDTPTAPCGAQGSDGTGTQLLDTVIQSSSASGRT